MALTFMAEMLAKLALCVAPQPKPHDQAALDDDVLLDEVFNYVGTGEFIYAAGVCRKWRRRYMKLSNDRVVVKRYCTDKLRTRYRSTIVTAARFQLALCNGLNVAAIKDDGYWWLVEQLIMMYSLEPVAVLLLVKQHGCDWSEQWCTLAAEANNLELLRWLRRSGYPWSLSCVRETALRLDDPAILKWLHSVTQPWSQKVLKEMLFFAGCDQNLELAKWLHEIGAPWPKRFYVKGGLGGGFWDPSMIEWALANGCTWGRWQCQDLLPQRWSCDWRAVCFCGGCCGKQACILLRYAHENGCPCTCDAETAAAVKTALEQQQQACGN
jgi:hypothetical protein